MAKKALEAVEKFLFRDFPRSETFTTLAYLKDDEQSNPEEVMSALI